VGAALTTFLAYVTALSEEFLIHKVSKTASSGVRTTAPSVQNKVGSKLDTGVTQAEISGEILSNLPDSDLIKVELEGFAVGVALCNDDVLLSLDCNNSRLNAPICEIIGAPAPDDLICSVVNVARRAKNEFRLGRCSFPTHVPSAEAVSLDAVGKTVLWFDGFAASAPLCQKAWPKTLFKLDNSDKFIEIFAFLEDEKGQAVIDLEGELLELHRVSYMSSICDALLRLHQFDDYRTESS